MIIGKKNPNLMEKVWLENQQSHVDHIKLRTKHFTKISNQKKFVVLEGEEKTQGESFKD